MLDGPVEVHFLTKRAFVDAVTGLDGVARTWAIDRTTAEVEKLQGTWGSITWWTSMPMRGRVRQARPAQGGGEDLRPDRGQAESGQDSPCPDRMGPAWRAACGRALPRHVEALRGMHSSVCARQGMRRALALPPVAPTAGESVEVVLHWARPTKARRFPRTIGRPWWQGCWKTVGGSISLEGRRSATRRPAEGVAGDQVVNRCGVTWTETFALLSKAALLVAGDTGAMHAGAALQVPMVVVWGCTSPALGMGPWRAHPDTVELQPEDPDRVAARAAGSETGAVTRHRASAGCRPAYPCGRPAHPQSKSALSSVASAGFIFPARMSRS